MKVVLDEDIPCSFGEVFEKLGSLVIDIHDTPLRGFPDEEIFRFAQREQAILVTSDKDFLIFVSVLKYRHQGLVIIRFPSRLSIAIRKQQLHKLLLQISPEDITGNIAVIRSSDIRIKK